MFALFSGVREREITDVAALVEYLELLWLIVLSVAAAYVGEGALEVGK